MILFKKATDLQHWIDAKRTENGKIGFIPTMGALHAGHLSLVGRAVSDGTLPIASIFVNPTQFNDPTDFEKYPVTHEQDIEKLLGAGCAAVFIPGVKEIYPDGIAQAKEILYDLGELETILEGEFRPGHYQGVAMVVHRLLGIVKPDRLYLGQKDFQQCLVIKRLLKLAGMEKIKVVVVPTEREPSGLAMSSRNERLTKQEREDAAVISKALFELEKEMKKKNSEPIPALLSRATDFLINAGLKPEYLELADPGTLQPIHKWDRQKPVVVLAAAWMGRVRLIDNILINP
jgi:pantoate--beta-alanine ligase